MDSTWTIARSISRRVQARLDQGPFVAHVLAVFEQACDLVTRDSDVVALVTPWVGDGPLNIVVEGEAGCFAQADPGAAVRLDGERLVTDGLEVDLRQAAPWNSRPDWETLRAGWVETTSHLPTLRELCLRLAPTGSLLTLLEGQSRGDTLSGNIHRRTHKAAQALQEGWEGNLRRLQEGAVGLAGLGAGLTPAGDDFLVGTMLGAWLAHPDPGAYCRTMVRLTVPHTTTLSAAYLQAAARGECAAVWHKLLTALVGGNRGEIANATRNILSHGATSGADALAGFLFSTMVK